MSPRPATNRSLSPSSKLTELLESLQQTAALTPQEATSMPPEAFTSEALLELERERIFSKEWICVGREDELSTPGDFFTSEVNQVPIIITRNRDGKLQALVNVCRHRMGRVAKGEGKTRVLTCPYHSWSYDLDGKLLNAPKMEDKQFDRSKFGLHQLRLEVWLGFVFVNMDADAEPLAPRLEPLKESLKNFRVEQMNVISKETTIWKTNWKVLCENFLEVYHSESVHRNTLYAIGGAETARPGDRGDDYNFYLFGPHDVERIGDADISEIVNPGVLVENSDLTDFERVHSPIGCIYPNLLVAVSWFGGAYFTAQPLSTGELRVEMGHFGPVTGLPFNSEKAHEFALKKLNDLSTIEDRVMVEDVYRSAQSGYGKPGPLHSKHEETIAHFIRYLSRKLTGK